MDAPYKKTTIEQSSEEVYSCLGCSRSFPSEKSLNGHMGRNPKCNKRYRRIVINRLSSPHPNHTIVTPTTTSLMGMVEWVKNLPAPIFRQRFCKEIEEFYKDWSTEDYYEGDGSEYEERYRRSLLAQLHQSAKSNIKMNTSKVVNDNPNMEKEIKMKKRKLGESSEENGHIHGEQYYLCDMCDKTFGSPQALGGHKTCHRKITTDRSLPAAAKTNEKAAQAKRHVCKICKEEFSTGPALGGHQRLHYQSVIGSVVEKEEEEVVKVKVKVKVGGKGKELAMDVKDEDGHGLPVQGTICHNIGNLHGEGILRFLR